MKIIKARSHNNQSKISLLVMFISQDIQKAQTKTMKQ